MGSFSVYCGISNITITEHQECLILPIKLSLYDDYHEYLPQMLPIFGKYDGYGGIKDIEKNDNTKLIEEYFGITIEEFCVFIVDGKYTHESNKYEIIKDKVKNLKEIENTRFLWIDRKVYEYLTEYKTVYKTCDLSFYKNDYFLKALGFNQINYTRWEFDGVIFDSGGYSLSTLNGENIYNVFGYNYDKKDITENSLAKYINIPKELEDLANSPSEYYWEYCTKVEAHKLLFWVLDIPRHSILNDSKYFMDSILDTYSLDKIEEYGIKINSEILTIEEAYIKEYKKHAHTLRKLVTMIKTFKIFSYTFKPVDLYLTSQFGEYKKHGDILEEFTKINKEHIMKHEDTI